MISSVEGMAKSSPVDGLQAILHTRKKGLNIMEERIIPGISSLIQNDNNNNYQ